MMTWSEILIVFFLASSFVGCQTLRQSATDTGVSRREMEALKSAAKALSGREISDDDIYRLANQLKNNSEERSAVESVTKALTKKPVIYYCPVDGERFSQSIKICPDHHVELMLLE